MPTKAQSEWLQAAYQMARRVGLPDTQARLAASQSAVETGYGKKVKGNSYFGIKPGRNYKGNTQSFSTTEEVNGKKIRVKSGSRESQFRAYDSVEDSFRDYAEVLRRDFPDAFNAETLQEAVTGLGNGRSGRYATASNYESLVTSVSQNLPETPEQPTQLASAVTPEQPAGQGGVRRRVGETVRLQNGGAQRNLPLADPLETALDDAITRVYGPGAYAEVGSGGQSPFGVLNRARQGLPVDGPVSNGYTGSTRHVDGEAADLRVFGPDGEQIKGDGLAPLAQFWRAQDIGGVGLEMANGGIHLDIHNNRAPAWSYGNRTAEQLRAINAGNQGQLPDLAVGLDQELLPPQVPAPQPSPGSQEILVAQNDGPTVGANSLAPEPDQGVGQQAISSVLTPPTGPLTETPSIPASVVQQAAIQPIQDEVQTAAQAVPVPPAQPAPADIEQLSAVLQGASAAPTAARTGPQGPLPPLPHTDIATAPIAAVPDTPIVPDASVAPVGGDVGSAIGGLAGLFGAAIRGGASGGGSGNFSEQVPVDGLLPPPPVRDLQEQAPPLQTPLAPAQDAELAELDFFGEDDISNPLNKLRRGPAQVGSLFRPRRFT